jgi:nitrogen fixation protein
VDIFVQAAHRWAASVPDKELEANIVMLRGDETVPVNFRDGWRIDVPARVILDAAHLHLGT